MRLTFLLQIAPYYRLSQKKPKTKIKKKMTMTMTMLNNITYNPSLTGPIYSISLHPSIYEGVIYILICAIFVSGIAILILFTMPPTDDIPERGQMPTPIGSTGPILRGQNGITTIPLPPMPFKPYPGSILEPNAQPKPKQYVWENPGFKDPGLKKP
jgi:hypothetical protein